MKPSRPLSGVDTIERRFVDLIGANGGPVVATAEVFLKGVVLTCLETSPRVTEGVRYLAPQAVCDAIRGEAVVATRDDELGSTLARAAGIDADV